MKSIVLETEEFEDRDTSKLIALFDIFEQSLCQRNETNDDLNQMIASVELNSYDNEHFFL